MAFKSPAINLIHSRKSFVDRFIDWALTFGRIVVIITEGVALSAFLYRFSLDQQIIDLHDSINHKVKLIQFQKSEEDRYRNIQSLLVQVAKLSTKIPVSVAAFSDITHLVPQNITINSFTVSNQVVELEASSQSIISLANFIQSLKSYNKLESVSLDKIENRTSASTIVVGISMRLKKQ